MLERIESQRQELKRDYTLVVVTHNMQQASRISDSVAFFLLGELVEHAPTTQMFKMCIRDSLEGEQHLEAVAGVDVLVVGAVIVAAE